ncbi:MAG TPA: chorismate mutase [Pyrinomonadaceae bacterium]|nr:chorismate mutase [Pyrinomonadaceae bacterium]
MNTEVHGFFVSEVNMSLEEYRDEIDRLDADIVKLINRRAFTVREIGLLKASKGDPVIDNAREAEVLGNASARAGKLIDPNVIQRIFAELLVDSKRIQERAASDLERIKSAT